MNEIVEHRVPEAVQHTVERVSARLAVLLADARAALRGERDFDVSDVRRFRESVRDMAPIASCSEEIRRQHPELAGPLEAYKSQLRELQTTLMQIRIMLRTRQATLNACKSHNTAVSRWASAFLLTR